MTTANLVADLRAALIEEDAANEEQMELVALCNANLKRRRAAEDAVSAAHAAIEECARGEQVSA